MKKLQYKKLNQKKKSKRILKKAKKYQKREAMHL
jgi:hypothetical protein